MKKTILSALILVLALMLPLAVSATEHTAQDKRIEGYYNVDSLPNSWNPLEDGGETADLILSLTADRLYHLSSDGKTLTPSLAVELPWDVTAEYAGTFGIPEGAVRGYAFCIELEPQARWEDGKTITADDLLFTIHQLIDRNALGIALANLGGYYAQAEKPGDRVISLEEAGFTSREEAEEAGHTAFYVDTDRFWGLSSGWVSIQDRTRLKDTAIPSGITEMYVSGAYLYQRYLHSGARLSYLQPEFLGISAEPAWVEREDLGLIRLDESRFLMILENPTTAEFLALKLSRLIPLRESKFADNYATSAATYCSSGPWRIASVKDGMMELLPNEYHLGKTAGIQADLIRLVEIGS